MTRFRITTQAAADLKNIGGFTQRQWGRKSRIEYLDRLQRVFNQLMANPELGKVREELSPAMRIFPVARHIVIFQVEDERDIVIIRVLHQSMDYMDPGSSLG